MSLNKLVDKTCRSINDPGLTKDGKPRRQLLLNDGGGLYLAITRNPRTGKVTKSWVFRWRDRLETYDKGKSQGVGKLREMGLGKYAPNSSNLEDHVTLALAREKAALHRRQVDELKDPIQIKREDRHTEQKKLQQARMADSRNVTFKWCFEQYMKAHAPAWKNHKHALQWRSSINTHAASLLDLPVADIDTPDVLACLQPIWTTMNETASRVRGRIESILGWATVSGYRSGDNPARWKHHLATVLPKPSAVQKVTHFAALHYDRMGEFMQKLRQDDRLQARALEFLILTAARPGMVASGPSSKGATWDEIDLEKKTWTVPAGRMKAKKEMVVPLSPQAIALLNALPRVRDCDFLFPGRALDQAISQAAMLDVAKSLAKSIKLKTTAHGLRSTFRDWAGETTAYPREVIEMALAHQLKDKAEAAYARGNLLAKRAKLMKDWAAYCDRSAISGDNVTAIRKGAKA